MYDLMSDVWVLQKQESRNHNNMNLIHLVTTLITWISGSLCKPHNAILVLSPNSEKELKALWSLVHKQCCNTNSDLKGDMRLVLPLGSVLSAFLQTMDIIPECSAALWDWKEKKGHYFLMKLNVKVVWDSEDKNCLQLNLIVM